MAVCFVSICALALLALRVCASDVLQTAAGAIEGYTVGDVQYFRGMWDIPRPNIHSTGNAERYILVLVLCSLELRALGVPFAEPPTGSRRFRPPVKKASWSGVRAAVIGGRMCPQAHSLGPLVIGTEGT